MSNVKNFKFQTLDFNLSSLFDSQIGLYKCDLIIFLSFSLSQSILSLSSDELLFWSYNESESYRLWTEVLETWSGTWIGVRWCNKRKGEIGWVCWESCSFFTISSLELDLWVKSANKKKKNIWLWMNLEFNQCEDLLIVLWEALNWIMENGWC